MARRLQMCLLALLLVCIGAMIWMSRSGRVEADPYKVELTELRVCLQGNSPGGTARPVGGWVLASETAVLACGKLSSTDPISLVVYLYKEPGIDPVDRNPRDDMAINGEFSSELQLPSEDGLGHYRIDVYAARNKLGSVDFDVVNQAPTQSPGRGG